MRTKLTSRLSLLFVSFALLLALPAIALADTITADPDPATVNVVESSVTMAAGGSGSVKVWLAPEDASDLVNGCNASTTTPVSISLSSSSPDVTFTNNPASIINCGSAAGKTIGYTVSSTAQNLPKSITVTASGSGGRTSGNSNTGINQPSYTTDSFTINIPAPSDSTAPSVSSINRADANPTNASSVGWDVTFSESVTGVDAGDFDLASNGLTGPDSINVTGTGTTRTVTASTGSGSGSLGLNLVDNDTIIDGANNKLGGTGTTGTADGSKTGDIYTIDKTKPVIGGSAKTLPGGANYTAGDWTNKDVEVSYSCDDGTGGSGIKTNTVAGATLTTSGADQSVTNTGSCTDNVGNVANSATFSNIDIDKVAPVISDDGRKALSDGQNGWYISEAFNKFSASDALSGLADSSTAGFTVGTGSGEGSGLTVASGAVSDNAGNTAASKTSAASFDVDLTDPKITGTLDKSPASTDWYNASTGAPTVDFECSDKAGGSGLAAGACPASYTFANGANQSHEGAVTDIAGRSARTTNVNGINVDLDAPNAPVATTDPLNPVANSGGFFKDAVTVSYGGSTDVGHSGIAGYSAAQTFGTTGTHGYFGTATDNAGNVSARTTGQVKVDATLPTVGITGCPTSPVLLNSTQSITVAASDEANGSGLVSDPSGQVALNTGSVGPQSKTIMVEDKVGHTKSATCSYSVKYGFSGFLQPINNTAHQIGTDISTFKAGSTVPVKFKLTDASGNVVQPASAPVWLTPLKGQATSQAVDEPVYTDSPTAGGYYRYDALSQQWIYNWSTKGLAGGFYYRIGVKLDDGQTYYQNISLR